MDCTEIINDMIDTLEPESLPACFIVCAKLSMSDGTDIVVDGSELAESLRVNRSEMKNYQVIINAKLIHESINIETAFVLAAVFG